jgi:TRAP transporter TAXI family solute receptor
MSKELGLIGLAVAATIATAAARAETIGFAAADPGSLFHSSGKAITKMANEAAGLKMTVQPFASATVYLPVINAGEYEFGISNTEQMRVAVTGDRWYRGRKYQDLRVVAIAYPLRLVMFVRKNSPIKSIADLRGKRVVSGYTSQKTIPPMLDAIYATAGMTQRDIFPVRVPNVVAGANAFIEGKVDSFTFALGAAKVREANASVGGIRALPIPNTPQVAAAVRKHFPPAYLRLEKPSRDNAGVLSPIYVMAFDIVVVASTRTPSDVVYKLTKAMHHNKKAMAKEFPVFNLFNPERMNSNLAPVKWHAGAIKYYKETGMWPPK